MLAEGNSVKEIAVLPGPQREDRGSAQVQPDAQARHSQQGAAGAYAIQKKIIKIPVNQ